jgi:hypothetical protein
MAEGQAEHTGHAEVRLHIDQHRFMSPAVTTGEALYKLGEVPPHHELFREVTGDREDVPVPNSGEAVHLGQDEHLHAGPREITLIVNGRKRKVTNRKESFADIVALAFDPVPTGPNIMFTITYRNGPHRNPEGSLLEGGKVSVRDGMIFDVTPTDKS